MDWRVEKRAGDKRARDVVRDIGNSECNLFPLSEAGYPSEKSKGRERGGAVQGHLMKFVQIVDDIQPEFGRISRLDRLEFTQIA